MILPTLELERELWRQREVVIGLDEVGRGALAGPVSVGALALRADCGEQPPKLRDSKAMTLLQREATAPLVAEWGVVAVGHASNAEIDEVGITRALGIAGRRALTELWHAGVPVDSSAILLDGAHDWLSPALTAQLAITTRVKADRDCAAVAGAACAAKVARDALMSEAEDAERYGWGSNKGYGSAAHMAAIRAHGPSELHRHSWLH